MWPHLEINELAIGEQHELVVMTDAVGVWAVAKG